MANRDAITYPSDYYWADEPDPKKLVDYCRDKIGEYQERMQRSSLLPRILRNWRYTHGLYWSSGGGPTAITSLGDEGELAGVAINEMRSQKEQILSIVTGNRPAFDAKAVNSDMASLSQTRLANQTLDYAMEKDNLEKFLVTAYDHSLVLGRGYVYQVWLESLGKPVRPDETGFMMREGDVYTSNPTIFDTAYDTRVRDHDTDLRWVMVRTKQMRWDLAARYPEVRDEILRYGEEEFSELEWCPIRVSDGDLDEENDHDLISVWTFHHPPCDALPDGRIFKFVGDIPLPGQDQADPYGFIPLSTVVPGDFMMTPHGYTPLFDLQGINEAINGEASSILSVHRNHGRPVIYMPTGTNLAPAQFEGFTFVEGDNPPQAVLLGQVPPDMFQSKQMFRTDGEYVTGINSVARGQPLSKESSGSALALIDAKAAQANSPGIRNYNRLICDVGTKRLKIYNTFLALDEERVIAVAGKHNRATISIGLKQGSFSRIDRVQVVAGNALTRSLSGRLQLLQMLQQFPSADGSPMLKTPDEVMNLVINGSFEPLTESEMGELNTIRDENEVMLSGMPVTAMVTDNHLLHIREHKTLLSTTESRMDDQLVSIVGAHMMEHVQHLMMGGPAVLYMQQLLGYMPPPPPTLGMPGAPGVPGMPQEVGVSPQNTPEGGNPPAMPGPTPDMAPAQMPTPPRAGGGQPASEMAA